MGWNHLSNAVLLYIPHGHCYLWKSELVLLHAISDALIAIAYFSIPCTLGYFVSKRKDLPHLEIFALFGLFIVSCGVTHIFEIWTLWHPTYWLSGSAKALTATVSVFTAVELFPIVPQALALKSPTELATTNLALMSEIAERRQIEAELQQSQNLVNNAFEFALVGNALVTPEGDWIKVNPALCKILGYSETELLETNFRDITYPENLEAAQYNIEQLLCNSIDACQFEKRYIHKQGHIIWTLLSISLVRDFKGEPSNFIVQIDDITERKQTELALNSQTEQLRLSVNERTLKLETAYAVLKKSKLQYQNLYNDAPDMYGSVNAESRKIVRCNRTLTHKLGYSKKEIIGSSIYEICHPDCLPQIEKALDDFMTTGEVKDAQLALQHQDGSKIEVSLNMRAVRGEDGQILHGRLSWRDITERKRLERELKQANTELEQRVQERTQQLQTAYQSLQRSQEQLELALEASHSSWWHWQVQTGELEWSPSYVQIFGFEEEELLAKYEVWEGLVHPEDMLWINEKLNAHLQDSSVPYAFDYRMRSKSGEWKWIANLGKVVERDEQGQPVRMAGMHYDITDRKQAEAKLQQLNDELSRSNQELSQFAYVASHDLQEPLRKIRSFSDLLANRYQNQLDDKADRYIHHITSGATRMQALIDDLLGYSRVGQTQLHLKPTHLDLVLQGVLSDLELVIEERKALILVNALPTVSVDSGQIRQLLQNLITNALKYCQADIPTVRVWATQASDTWTISIQDNGIGIDSQFSDRIFAIFERLHHKDTYSGTGIGLAICKRIVERHGGQIWVNSQEGQGSTFSFTLPTS